MKNVKFRGKRQIARKKNESAGKANSAGRGKLWALVIMHNNTPKFNGNFPNPNSQIVFPPRDRSAEG